MAQKAIGATDGQDATETEPTMHRRGALKAVGAVGLSALIPGVNPAGGADTDGPDPADDNEDDFDAPEDIPSVALAVTSGPDIAVTDRRATSFEDGSLRLTLHLTADSDAVIELSAEATSTTGETRERVEHRAIDRDEPARIDVDFSPPAGELTFYRAAALSAAAVAD
jgi:hypothetical protein